MKKKAVKVSDNNKVPNKVEKPTKKPYYRYRHGWWVTTKQETYDPGTPGLCLNERKVVFRYVDPKTKKTRSCRH